MFGAKNAPSSLVVNERTTASALLGSVMVTVAPLTSAPVESLTVPRRSPVTSWPSAAPLIANRSVSNEIMVLSRM